MPIPDPATPAEIGVIIVDHGSRRAQSNASLEEVARLFAQRFSDAPIVEAAHMELAMPDIAAAYDACVRRGARRIVILPFFLAQGKHWTRDIPSLTSQAAEKHPGTAYQIAEPLGIDDLILDLLKKRLDADDQPVLASGEADPRLAEVAPTERRIQCATCPFVLHEDLTVTIKPGSGIG
ncbi:CbiX/SirB N-terminal domain-containing protein [Phycisphaera mikurensis]|uniref:Putative sirohydrochlorin cobaltochelatase n=1 Tax=Phycisphaera mikurensis (strain NBRC 102666 / KCTC 22515 / FYK2301M01) TaxID=1142394 RepID=I0IEY0_PHYMF|nr:CbiX/SirB N-terminal domain-containing protein [Phycisphaera mikurensis]MBB6441612.1 sirohydrochlorin ferrochelatase [Phycisphaera mikurensis]BAM03818.1 putative sirohydrochlorin cobaltochelatase [Phycisphaera mikurensis NBRC 102666]